MKLPPTQDDQQTEEDPQNFRTKPRFDRSCSALLGIGVAMIQQWSDPALAGCQPHWLQCSQSQSKRSLPTNLWEFQASPPHPWPRPWWCSSQASPHWCWPSRSSAPSLTCFQKSLVQTAQTRVSYLVGSKLGHHHHEGVNSSPHLIDFWTVGGFWKGPPLALFDPAPLGPKHRGCCQRDRTCSDTSLFRQVLSERVTIQIIGC